MLPLVHQLWRGDLSDRGYRPDTNIIYVPGFKVENWRNLPAPGTGFWVNRP